MEDEPRELTPEEIKPLPGEATPPYLQRYQRLYWYQPDRKVYVRADVLGKRSREHVEKVNAERAARRKASTFQKRLL
jgi:hypothetical protein